MCAGRLGDARGFVGVLRHFAHAAAHLGDGSGGGFRGVALAAGTVGGLLGVANQRLGRAGDFRRIEDDARDDAMEGADQFVVGVCRWTNRTAPWHFDPAGEVAVAARGGDRIAQFRQWSGYRLADVPGRQPGDQQSQHQVDADQAGADAAAGGVCAAQSGREYGNACSDMDGAKAPSAIRHVLLPLNSCLCGRWCSPMGASRLRPMVAAQSSA